MVFPRRRQPGDVQRHQGRLRRPTARAPATATSTCAIPIQTTRRATGASKAATSRARRRSRCAGTTASSTTQDETLQWTNPFFGGNQLDTTYLRAGQHVQQVHGDRQLPRPAVAFGDLGALHVGEDDEQRRPRRSSRSTAAPARVQPDDARHRHVQRRERQPVVRARRGRRTRSRTSTRASTTTGRSSRTTRTRSSTATRRRSRSRAASAAATSWPAGVADADRRQLRATSSTTTRRTTSASTCGGASRKGQRLGFGYDYLDLDQNRVDYDKSHYEQGVGRVQEHDARHAVRPRQVPVPEARLDAELQQRPGSERRREQPELPAAVTRRRSTCRAARPTRSSCTSTGRRCELLGFSFEGNWTKQDYDDVTYGRTNNDTPGLLPERQLGRLRAS